MRARLTRQGRAEKAAEKIIQAGHHSSRLAQEAVHNPARQSEEARRVAQEAEHNLARQSEEARRVAQEAEHNLARQSEEAQRVAQEARTEAELADFEARLAELDARKAERQARQRTLDPRRGNMEEETRGSPQAEQIQNSVPPQGQQAESASRRNKPEVEDDEARRARHARRSPKARRHRRTTPEINHVARGPRQDVQATSDDCPFCDICKAYRHTHQWNEWRNLDEVMQPDLTDPPSYVVYSGEHVMAFLDRSPLTYGHTLVIPRVHKVRMGDLDSIDGAEVSVLFALLLVLRDFSSIHTTNIKIAVMSYAIGLEYIGLARLLALFLCRPLVLAAEKPSPSLLCLASSST